VLVASLLLSTACSKEDPASSKTISPSPGSEQPAPAPSPSSTGSATLEPSVIREIVHKNYEDLGRALTRSDVEGSLAFYHVPFRKEEVELDREQLKADLEGKLQEMNAMGAEETGTLRFSSKTEIQDLQVEGDEVIVKVRETLTARALGTNEQAKVVRKSTDAWKQVDGKWKLRATRGIVQTQENEVNFSEPPSVTSTSEPDEEPTEETSDGPKEAYLSYLEAISEKDFDEYISLRGKRFEAGIKYMSELDAADKSKLMDALAETNLQNVEITDVQQSGESAKLMGTSTADNPDGGPPYVYQGNVEMVLEDGKWKVNEESWESVSQ